MYYYEVDALVDLSGRKKLLTYSSDISLGSGAVVEVPFGQKSLLAIVQKAVGKPDFKTKPIKKVVYSTSTPKPWQDLIEWFRGFYPVKNNELHNLFLPNFLARPAAQQSSKTTTPQTKNLTLNSEQQAAVDAINNTTKPLIIHGDMGSGKTLVYFEAARKVLKSGHSVLLLAPEIPLTVHLQKQAEQFFKDIPVFLYHSARTDKERRQVWQACLENDRPFVLIGARSALFLPIKDLGLICVDELHENAYRQQESPHYGVIDVAAKLAKLHGSKIVYGSATPPIKELFVAEQKAYPVIRMTGQAAAKANAKSSRLVQIIDQRDRSKFATDPYLSNQLLDEIKQALGAGKQSLIFHNRRGTARVVLCSRCGWSLKCEFCDVNHVYHHDQNVCRCHICGRTKPLPVVCPECGNSDLVLKSVGVKALEERLRTHFPTARIARFDSDNPKAESLASRIDELKNKQIDIIIGTQLVAKGLDLKDLQVVGITNADTSLYLPDYTSSERMFQLVVQAMGRVGRGHGDGVCIIQTHQPNNPIFEYLKTGNFESFYKTELAERKLFLYPPFSFLLKLTCRRKTDSGAEKAARTLADKIKEVNTHIEVVGPSSSFFGRVSGQYEWQIIIKSKQRSTLLSIARDLPANWQAEMDPVGLL